MPITSLPGRVTPLIVAPVTHPLVQPSLLGLVPLIESFLGRHTGQTVVEALDEAIRRTLLVWATTASITLPATVRVLNRRAFDAERRRGTRADELLFCRDSGRMAGDYDTANALYAHVRGLREDRVQTRVYASGVTECARKLVYGLRNAPKEPTGVNNPEWLVAAELGNIIHALLEDWLLQMEVSEQAEYRLGTEHWSGRADHRIVRNGQRYILDVKSVKRRDFDLGASGPKFKKYVAQLHLYSHQEGLSQAIVLLFCRDTGRMQEFVVAIDPAETLRWELRAAEAYNAAQVDTLPAAEEWGPAEAGSFSCQNFCPYYGICAQARLLAAGPALVRSLDEF